MKFAFKGCLRIRGFSQAEVSANDSCNLESFCTFYFPFWRNFSNIWEEISNYTCSTLLRPSTHASSFQPWTFTHKMHRDAILCVERRIRITCNQWLVKRTEPPPRDHDIFVKIAWIYMRTGNVIQVGVAKHHWIS